MSRDKIRKEDLTRIKGIGDKLANKILKELKGEEGLTYAVKNLEVDRISSVDGISQKKAIEIMNELLGDPLPHFLKSERAFQLYKEIIEKILTYANTQHSRNRILLLHPKKDPQKIKKHLKMVMDFKKLLNEIPVNKIRNLLQEIETPQEVKPTFNPSRAILVENKEDYNRLVDMGLNKYHPILLNPENGELNEYELVIYLYSEGKLDLEGIPNILMVHSNAKKHEIAPETVLDYFNANKKLFKKALKLKKLLGEETILEEVNNTIQELEKFKSNKIDIEEHINHIKSEADKELHSMIKDINLKGEEVLKLLNKGTTKKLDKIFENVIKKAKKKLKEETGIESDPFIKSYPLRIDKREIERIKNIELSERMIRLFDKKTAAANKLLKLKSKAEKEIKEILEFDYKFTLGSFARNYNLQKPKISNKLKLKGALHLKLALKDKKDVQRIDYCLDDNENVALLTGANSGGKTTLLETLAQVVIMTQMGIPVCAEKAHVKLFDEIYFLSQKRSMDAGAFESFLKTFTPLLINKKQKLILLDEIETITELEAAVKIIASFIELIKDSKSYAVIVTHMAREIIDEINVRVDGIEAKGLDHEYNLIVDRTPKMNYLAKSTPELILKMMYEKSEGKTKKIYGKILRKFN